MIKILHVISDTNIGGAGVHLCNLLACADRQQFDITVALPRASALAPRIKDLDIPVIETQNGADRSADLRAVPELLSVLRRIRPHILHTHSALYARLAGKLSGVPASVNTRHCADMSETRPGWGKRLALGHFEKFLGTQTIATADYVKDVLVGRGLNADRISIIRNGSLSTPRLSHEEKQALRTEFGLREGNFTVGMVARLAEGKGHETFLRAAKLCLGENRNIRFLIIGSGDKEDSLKKLAIASGISEQVQFLGFRRDARHLMNLLDVNVNCSRVSETSALSLSEGMSVGAVPVVSDCGGNPFMAGFGRCGAIFPIDDAPALAGILLSLSKDPSKHTTLSKNCQRRFREEFTAEAMTRRTEALYKTMLEPEGHLDFFPKE